MQAQEQWIIEILKTESFQGHTGSILANAASGTNKSPSDPGSLQYSVELNYLSLIYVPRLDAEQGGMPIDF